jgi:hypothetical protein
MAPRGKRCSQCLCCDAIIVFEGEALCAACDDGTHPALPERHNKFEPDSANCPAQKEGEATPTGSIARAATSSEPSNPQPFKEEPMQRVTGEMKQAIREASASESCASIAKRLGMKESTVWWHRNKFRNEAKSEKPVKGMDAGAQLLAEIAGHALSHSVQATFQVTDKIVDGWWKGLTRGDKAAIFAGNYVIRVEGSVQ